MKLSSTHMTRQRNRNCVRDVEQEHGQAHPCFSILTSYSGTHVPQVPPQSKNMGPGLIVCLKTNSYWYLTCEPNSDMYICTNAKPPTQLLNKYDTSQPYRPSYLKNLNSTAPIIQHLVQLYCTVTLTFWPYLLPPLHDDPGWPWQLHKLSCDLPIHDRVGATLHTLHHSCITSVSLNSL